MSIRTITRRGIVLLLATLVSGCSLAGFGGSASRKDDCVAEPSQCRYEPGEKEYAEREAARRNQAEADRLRRRGGW